MEIYYGFSCHINFGEKKIFESTVILEGGLDSLSSDFVDYSELLKLTIFKTAEMAVIETTNTNDRCHIKSDGLKIVLIFQKQKFWWQSILQETSFPISLHSKQQVNLCCCSLLRHSFRSHKKGAHPSLREAFGSYGLKRKNSLKIVKTALKGLSTAHTKYQAH